VLLRISARNQRFEQSGPAHIKLSESSKQSISTFVSINWAICLEERLHSSYGRKKSLTAARTVWHHLYGLFVVYLTTLKIAETKRCGISG